MRGRARSWLWGLVLLAVGAVVGYAWPQNNASPSSETGVVTAVSHDSAASDTHFMFKPKGSSSAEKLLLKSATPWQASPKAKWSHGGTPTCLVTGEKSITIGIVNVHGVNNAPGGLMVTWVECYR